MSTLAREVGVYLGLTCAFSSVFWAFAIVTGHHAGGNGAYAIGLMWSPGLAALVTCKLRGISLRNLGWSWGEPRWQMLAYVTPLVVCVLAYGLVWGTRLGGVPNPELVAKSRDSLGWAGAPDGVVVAGWFLLSATTGIVRGVAFGLGEEIGWRGFLAPRLHRGLGFTGGALLTGAIWALWHVPLILFSDYDTASPWWFATPCFVISVLGMSVVMSWLRLRSGSLWTGAVTHGSINLFNQGIFAPLTTSVGWQTAYSIDESGFALSLMFALVAFVFWRRRASAVQAEQRRVVLSGRTLDDSPQGEPAASGASPLEGSP